MPRSRFGPGYEFLQNEAKCRLILTSKLVPVLFTKSTQQKSKIKFFKMICFEMNLFLCHLTYRARFDSI